jgi:hypothetical protein
MTISCFYKYLLSTLYVLLLLISKENTFTKYLRNTLVTTDDIKNNESALFSKNLRTDKRGEDL